MTLLRAVSGTPSFAAGVSVCDSKLLSIERNQNRYFWVPRHVLQDICFQPGFNNTIPPGVSHTGIVLPGVVGPHLTLLFRFSPRRVEDPFMHPTTHGYGITDLTSLE